MAEFGYGGLDFDPEDWYELDPDGPLVIWFEDPEDLPEWAIIKRNHNRYYAMLPVRDWIALSGRGLLCTTEA